MATVTRTKTWISGDVLTASDLNAEFNNLLGALALGDSDVSGGIAPSKISGTAVTLAGTQTLTNKTLSGANNTLTVREADLSISDNTTKDVSTSAHGFVPKAPDDTTKFLRGDASWQPVPASSFKGCRVYRSTSTQSIGNTSATKVQMNGESFDPSSLFDSSTNYRFTPTTAGKYQVNFTAAVVLNASGDVLRVMIYKNGVQHSQNEVTLDAGRTTTAQSTISDILDMNGSSDYIEFYVFQNSGDTRNLTQGENITCASMVLIGS